MKKVSHPNLPGAKFPIRFAYIYKYVRSLSFWVWLLFSCYIRDRNQQQQLFFFFFILDKALLKRLSGSHFYIVSHGANKLHYVFAEPSLLFASLMRCEKIFFLNTSQGSTREKKEPYWGGEGGAHWYTLYAARENLMHETRLLFLINIIIYDEKKKKKKRLYTVLVWCMWCIIRVYQLCQQLWGFARLIEGGDEKKKR